MKRPSTKGIKDIMQLIYGRRCMVCGKRFDKLEYHHIIEFSKGGETTIANGSLVCQKDHKQLHRGKKAEYTQKIIAYKQKIEYKNPLFIA